MDFLFYNQAKKMFDFAFFVILVMMKFEVFNVIFYCIICLFIV